MVIRFPLGLPVLSSLIPDQNELRMTCFELLRVLCQCQAYCVGFLVELCFIRGGNDWDSCHSLVFHSFQSHSFEARLETHAHCQKYLSIYALLVSMDGVTTSGSKSFFIDSAIP